MHALCKRVSGRGGPLPFMRVALAGCVHGELNRVYAEVGRLTGGRGADVVLCCGDFQSLRDERDLPDLHCPDKYKRLGDFADYHRGLRVAPCLTIFVGGNHEASGALCLLPRGGWVAPGIFYAGLATVVRVASAAGSLADGRDYLRVGGVSGIYKDRDVDRPRGERLPLRGGDRVSCYHMRRADVAPFFALPKNSPVDVMVSHDWPRGIERAGGPETLANLLRVKKHFAEDVRAGRLGNPLTRPLLDHLSVRLWAAAHLHVHFEVKYARSGGDGGSTHFVALDKPASARRQFVKVVDFGEKKCAGPLQIFFDEAWVEAVARAPRTAGSGGAAATAAAPAAATAAAALAARRNTAVTASSGVARCPVGMQRLSEAEGAATPLGADVDVDIEALLPEAETEDAPRPTPWPDFDADLGKQTAAVERCIAAIVARATKFDAGPQSV